MSGKKKGKVFHSKEFKNKLKISFTNSVSCSFTTKLPDLAESLS